MCGISGVYAKNGNVKEIKEAVERINAAQNKRGPDDKGIEIINDNPAVVFGHSRLSILDLSPAGHQPMQFSYYFNNLLTITFNGEIYNFLELKKDLEQKDYKFKTNTDTEVILALYAEYGEKSFLMLRGMFAFGLWDEAQKKLFLVKDRYGIKPLYYYGNEDKFIFASTVKAIEQSGLISVKKNQKALMGFLLFGSVPLPMTTIENILAVPAGHYLEISDGGVQKLVEYYNPLEYFLTKSKDDFETASEKIKILLENSVKYHLISDAPLGVFLSGGLDSSAIAAVSAIIAEQREIERGTTQKKQNLNTISIIFDEEEFSEKKYQQMVVNKIKSDHKEIKITKKDFEVGLDEIFEAMDQPTIDGVNTFFVSKAANKADLKAVLSGLGSDEIFMGYPAFKKAAILRKIQKSPLKAVIKLLSYLVIEPFFKDRWAKLGYLKKDTPVNFYLSIRGLFAPKEVAKILNIGVKDVENFISDLESSILASRFPLLASLHPADLLSYLELKFYLQNQLLKDTDFMSMAHSIEVRVPFLDHKLVEYLSSLPAEIKVNGYSANKLLNNSVTKLTNNLMTDVNKPLLVEAVRDILPEEIFTRPKMGFTFPFQKWFLSKISAKGGSASGGKGQLSKVKKHWSRYWAKIVLSK